MGLLIQWLTIQRTASRVLSNADIVSKRERDQTNRLLSFGVLEVQTKHMACSYGREDAETQRVKAVNSSHDLERRVENQVGVIQKKGRAGEGGSETQELSQRYSRILHLSIPCAKVAAGPLDPPLQINT